MGMLFGVQRSNINLQCVVLVVVVAVEVEESSFVLVGPCWSSPSPQIQGLFPATWNTLFDLTTVPHFP